MTCNYVKDPASVLDYTVDWADYLVSDTISTSTWTVPAGITLDSQSNTATTTTVWLSGGTHNTAYTATNKVTTAGGRTVERSIWVKVENV